MTSDFLMGISILCFCAAISFGLVAWMHLGMRDFKEFCAFNACVSCFFSCTAIVCLLSYAYLV